ncbi:MAG: hypothetical protein QHJ73_04850 [Armatimonadota bacterium]|nr:hypothetical protein [Armatimonadota bacterium]
MKINHRAVWHPLLLGVFPVLSLAAANVERVPLGSNMLRLVLWFALGAAVAFVVFSGVFRNTDRGALMASLSVILFSSFGPIRSVVSGLTGPKQSTTVAVVAEAFVWALVAWVLARTPRDLRRLTATVNAAALFLVLLPLSRLGAHTVKGQAYRPASAEPVVTAAANTAGSRPDIYYIIFDRYASTSTLRDYYQFDNSAFVAELTRMGFYVVEHAYANYLKTGQSLAASLNMTHLTHLGEAVGEDSGDWTPVFQMLQDHRVGKFLKEQGYTYIHVGAGFEATHFNPNADANLTEGTDSATFFAQTLREQTMASLFVGPFFNGGIREQHWATTRYQLECVQRVVDDPRPTFTFAHILVPHSPYVFDRNGRLLPSSTVAARTESENYLEQLRYATNAAAKLVSDIIARSENPPIILLQSDEGPFPERYRVLQAAFDWRTATPDELRQKLGILNAYYLPGGPRGLYPTITPVNSFRVVFNRFFGTKLPLLPDRSYAFQDESHLYRFRDVTDILRRADPPRPVRTQVALGSGNPGG